MRSVPQVTRRDILKAIASTTATISFRRAWSDAYRQANSDWFAACQFGISTHWTAQSQPVGKDDWLPFEEAVNRFDAKRYVQQAAEAGAQYIIFTSCHALQMLPAPCAAIDRVAPGRTTRRDLVGDLADACHARGMHFILYYNHSCNHGDDSPWEYAVGYHAPDKAPLARNLLAIVRELAERYGSRVDGWWFDSCFSLDPRGVYDSVSTDFNGFQFPWEDFVAAAKAGHEQRLVSLSSGMLTHFLYSSHQDYEGGEANDLVAVPSSRYTPDHLQAHRWVCLDNPDWVHSRVMTPFARPRFKSASVADYVSSCNRTSVPVTFNVDIDRTGAFSPESLAFLREVKGRLKA
ncbi:MAG TPA: alpha-L-fucosidase [Terracidiphilus sp.]|nr:alpha-L-fucosidase [Terracidiphilus sp.]